MRKAIVGGAVLLFFAASSTAFACGWGKARTAESGVNQTVMTDTDTKTTTTKKDTKG